MTDRRLTPEELESLLGAPSDPTAVPNGAPLADSTRPERPAAPAALDANPTNPASPASGSPTDSAASGVRVIAGLRRLHGALTRPISDGTSELVRAVVDVRLADLASVAYASWAGAGAANACVGVFRAAGGEEACLLRLDGEILRALVDGLLGGTDRDRPHAGRPLTEWELRMSVRAIEPIRKAWLDAWSGWSPLQIATFRPLVNSNARIGWPATQRLFLARYLISLGSTTGPLEMLTPLDLAMRWMSPQWSRNDSAERMAGGSAGLPIGSPSGPTAGSTSVGAHAAPTGVSHVGPAELRVMLADTLVPRDELDALQVGDVLATDHRVDRPLDAHLPNGTHVPVQLGIVDGKKAVRP